MLTKKIQLSNIIIIALTISITIANLLGTTLSFSPHDYGHPVGFISANDYQKSFEMFVFYFIAFSFPLVSILLKKTINNIKLWQILIAQFICILLVSINNFDLFLSGLIVLFLFFLHFVKTPELTSNNNVEDPSKKYKLVFFFLIPLAVYYSKLYIIPTSLDLFHDGEFLAPVSQFNLGGTVYKDFYLQHGFFHNFLIPKIACGLFGESLESIRLIHTLIQPIPYVLIYFLLLIVFNNNFFYLAISYLILASNNFEIHHRLIFAITICILTALYLKNHLETKKFAFLSGLSSALAFLYSTEVGIYSSIAFVLFILLSTEKKVLILVYFISGFALILLPFALYLFSQNAFDAFISNIWIQTQYQLDLWATPVPDANLIIKAFNDFSINSSVGFWIFSISLIFISESYLLYQLLSKKKLNRTNQMIFLLSLFSIFFFRSALGRSDITHLYFATVFLMIIPLLMISQYLQSKRIIIITITALFFSFAFIRFQPVRSLYSDLASKDRNIVLKKYTHLDAPYKSAKQKLQIQSLHDYLINKDSVFVLSNQGAYYFLLQKKSPTKFYNIMYAAIPELEQEVIEDLLFSQPDYVIWDINNEGFSHDGVSVPVRLPKLIQYIENNYQQDQNILDILLFKRI